MDGGSVYYLTMFKTCVMVALTHTALRVPSKETKPLPMNVQIDDDGCTQCAVIQHITGYK